MSLEDALETQTIATQRRSILSLSGLPSSQLQEPEPAALRPPQSPLSTSTDSSQFKFDFEDDLESSRVYRRAQRDTMDFSFRSSIARSNAWSVFSGLSLSDISIISVIGLPVLPKDITNAYHYNFEVTSTRWRPRDITIPRDIPIALQQRLVSAKCDILKVNILQVPGMEVLFDQMIYSADSFHHLREVLSQASPVTLLQALSSQIDVPLQRRKENFSEPEEDLSSRAKRLTTMWFLKYCRSDLNVPIDSLFTMSDLTDGDYYGVLKVWDSVLTTCKKNSLLTST